MRLKEYLINIILNYLIVITKRENEIMKLGKEETISGLTVKKYDVSELTNLNVIWRRNLFGSIKDVMINFNPNDGTILSSLFNNNNKHLSIHKLKKQPVPSFKSNVHDFTDITENTLRIDKNEKISIESTEFLYSIFNCSVSGDGKYVVILERLFITDKSNINKKHMRGIRVSCHHINGYIEIHFTSELMRGLDIAKWRMNNYERDNKRNTLFDRLMRKYFSFYK